MADASIQLMKRAIYFHYGWTQKDPFKRARAHPHTANCLVLLEGLKKTHWKNIIAGITTHRCALLLFKGKQNRVNGCYAQLLLCIARLGGGGGGGI